MDGYCCLSLLKCDVEMIGFLKKLLVLFNIVGLGNFCCLMVIIVLNMFFVVGLLSVFSLVYWVIGVILDGRKKWICVII